MNTGDAAVMRIELGARRFSTSELPMLTRLVDARKEQVRLLEALAVTAEPSSALDVRPLFVSIDGQPQDQAILALVRPVVEREVRARIASLDRDIEALGVIVSS